MKTVCDACNSPEIREIYRLDRIPAFQNKLFSEKEHATAAPVAKVSLCHCPKCDLVFNAAFDASLMDYDTEYQNAQDHSPTFRQYLLKIADIITQGVDKTAAHIVEIGCGKGYFLQHLVQAGFHVTGFDPTYEGDDPRIVKKYFDSETATGITATHVIMRHTLEHIERPYDFLCQLKEILDADTQIFIEIPRFEWIGAHAAFWDIFHEHCNYFTEHFFDAVFAGKLNISRTFNDQYMVVHAKIGDIASLANSDAAPAVTLNFNTDVFLNKVKTAKTNYVWGAGAKGIAFVNILDPQAAHISAVIDINQSKQGHYVPLTGHACVAPTSVDWRKLGRNDNLWIMNGNYAEEILATLPADFAATVVVIDKDHT